MAYPGVNWKNDPDHTSPINAANLEIMDNGIVEADANATAAKTEVENVRVGTYGTVYSSAGDAVREQIKSVSEHTDNIANVLNASRTNWGVTVNAYSSENKVEISGTATGSGDTVKFLQQTLDVGTYYIQLYGTCSVDIQFNLKNANGTYWAKLSYTAGNQSISGKFVLSESKEFYMIPQAINGRTYDGEFLVQIVKSETEPTQYIKPITALDNVARNVANNANNKANSNAEAIGNKLDDDYYFGIGKVLENNQNEGENTASPTLLYARSNEDHYPGVRIVQDTESPVKRLFGYKHEIYKGTQTGWQSIINRFPFLSASTSSFCIGFWTKVSEIKEVFANTNHMDFNFLVQSKRMTFGIYPKLMIANIGTVYDIGLMQESTGILESADVSAVCLYEDNGYAYIKVDVQNMVYVSGFDFSLLANLNLYWRFDDVKTALSNKQLTIVGLTVVLNDTIESGYYRHPDGSGLEQLPPEKPIYENEGGGGEIIKPLQLVYRPGMLEDVLVKCSVGETEIENYMVGLYDDVSYNRTCRPTACFVSVDGVKKQVMKSEDDGCPINLTSGYLAAGHGYARGEKITKTNHGLTYADIGSLWDDAGNNRFCLIRIFDADNFGIMPVTALTANQYDLVSINPTGTLSHVSGAVHTSSISDYTYATWQIEPIVMQNQVKKILLDGKENVEEAGTYYADFVDVIDEYDVANPQTIVSAIIANKPSGGYTENPDPNVGTSFLHFSNVYRFLNDGTLLIYSTVDNDVVLNLGYWGGTQYAEKNAANVFGGVCKKYLPGTLPVEVDGVTYDMRIPKDMTNWNASLNYPSDKWENGDYPPSRIVTFYTDNQNVIKAGYAVGCLPIGLGDSEVRKNNVDNALNLYSSEKYYPHLIDSQNIPAYTPLQSVVYRRPVIDVAGKHTSAYFVPYGSKCYLYVDYHAIADDRIKVPAEYIGLQMKVVEKTDNVNVYGAIATDEIRIRCLTANPMYGYAVIQIGE